MVNFDDCEGNIGALTFMCEAYMKGSVAQAMKAETAFERVINAGIKGTDLYILWNDCCNRDTNFTLEIMINRDIEDIKQHIKGDGCRGASFIEDTNNTQGEHYGA